jgi:1-acyl-sn-glycerol-3-phosphate acyltransferase
MGEETVSDQGKKSEEGKEYPLLVSGVLSLAFWATLAVFCIFFNVLGIVLFLPLSIFGADFARSIVHHLACQWARAVFACSPVWKLTVTGRENLRPGRHYVFVANHQSQVDILVALAGISNPFKFIAKKELFSLPFYGWHMYLAGYISIDRSSMESAKQTILKAQCWLRKGVGVLFFPEGTRSLDGRIHPFKPGAFQIAQSLEIEVVPLVIDGTLEAIPKNKWRIRKPTKFVLSIGKPVRIPKEETPRQLLQTRDEIRAEMMNRLAQIRSLCS